MAAAHVIRDSHVAGLVTKSRLRTSRTDRRGGRREQRAERGLGTHLGGTKLFTIPVVMFNGKIVKYFSNILVSVITNHRHHLSFNQSKYLRHDIVLHDRFRHYDLPRILYLVGEVKLD